MEEPAFKIWFNSNGRAYAVEAGPHMGKPADEEEGSPDIQGIVELTIGVRSLLVSGIVVPELVVNEVRTDLRVARRCWVCRPTGCGWYPC